MYSKQVALFVTLLTLPSFAGTLKVACGKNGYEALEKNKPELADVYATAQLRGATNPPQNVSVKASGISDLSDKNSAITFSTKPDGTKSLKVNRRGNPYDSVELSVKGCDKLDNSSGSAVVKKYTGGFAGTQPTFYDNCNCLTD